MKFTDNPLTTILAASFYNAPCFTFLIHITLLKKKKDKQHFLNSTPHSSLIQHPSTSWSQVFFTETFFYPGHSAPLIYVLNLCSLDKLSPTHCAPSSVTSWHQCPLPSSYFTYWSPPWRPWHHPQQLQPLHYVKS